MKSVCICLELRQARVDNIQPLFFVSSKNIKKNKTKMAPLWRQLEELCTKFSSKPNYAKISVKRRTLDTVSQTLALKVKESILQMLEVLYLQNCASCGRTSWQPWSFLLLLNFCQKNFTATSLTHTPPNNLRESPLLLLSFTQR